MKRQRFSLIKIFGSVPVHPDKFKELDKKLKWLGECEEGDFCVGCGTLTPFISKSHHVNCSSYKDSGEYDEYVSELGRCPECDSPDGLSMDSSMELELSQISCSDCRFIFQRSLCEEDLIIAFNNKYQRASDLGAFSYLQENNMFKHELGQVVQVTISGEEGHIKGRAEYQNDANQYYFHYLSADGRAMNAWFEEGELSPVELKLDN